jgi:hypothetical protein
MTKKTWLIIGSIILFYVVATLWNIKGLWHK